MIDDLEALRDRLIAAQRHVLLSNVRATALPPEGVLARIANLEQTINASQVLIDEMTAGEA